MKLPKLVAIILIIGLTLQSAAFKPFPTTSEAAPEYTPVTPSRNSDISLMGSGEQSIDPFVVHPVNRWDEISSGDFDETIAEGEIEWNSLRNGSGTKTRFRESQTTDDEIGVRWRLDAVADFNTNETDYATQVGLWGLDGWSFEEGTDDDFDNRDIGTTSNLAVIGTTIRISATGVGSTTTGWSNEETNIITSAWLDDSNQANFRFRANASENGLRFKLNVGGTTSGFMDQALTTTMTTYDLNNNTANFAGTLSSLGIVLRESDGDGNLDADEIMWVEFLRIFRDDEYQGDFQIPISGINATILGGVIGNTTLNAVPWNATHYIIQQTMSTDEGYNWRSWNIGSNYQDYMQLNGSLGADGWDFLEETDEGWATVSGAALSQELGWMNVSRTIADSVFGISYNFDEDNPTSNQPLYDHSFDWLEVKVKGTVGPGGGIVSAHNLRFFVSYSDGTTSLTTLYADNLPTMWRTYSYNLSLIAEWANINVENKKISAMGVYFASQSAGAGALIDYIRLTSTNVTSDLTFLEYKKYYRSELDYDLRASNLKVNIMDDSGSTLVKESIGDFAIYNFFDADDIIPIILFADVGQIDYLFGATSTGANVTMNWDFYEAEFAAFYFKHILTEENGDTWEGIGPYTAHNQADAGGATSVTSTFQLTVPDFDSASGRLTAEDTAFIANAIGIINFTIWSVDTDDGEMHLEGTLLMSTSTTMSFTYLQSTVPGDETFNLDVSDARNGPGFQGYRSATFSLFNDKQLDTLSMQISGIDQNNQEDRQAATWTPIGDSNEIVFQIKYEAISDAINAEVSLILEDWKLTFKDLFGLPINLPSIDDAVGGLFDIILWPIIAILNLLGAVPAAIIGVIDALGNVLSQLTSLSGIMDLLDDAFALVGDGIELALSGMEGVLETALGLVEDAVDLVTEAVDLVTEAIVALAGGIWDAVIAGLSDALDIILGLLSTIWDAVVTFIRDITIQDVNVGSVLDAVFKWLSFFSTTATTTLEFIIMIMVTWGVMMMVFLFLGIIFFSIGSANAPGEVFGNIFKAYSTNTMPFSVSGFNMHVPLALWNIPFIFLIILGIV